MTNREDALIEKILRLKEQRNAIILAHNYQLGEVQDIADFVGDSLELSQKAAKIDVDVIVFCGVHFMAETAFILSPDKTVLLPDMHAGCPMADMITAEQLREKKKELPKAVVVCYINSSAEVKAESDVCCTSANAVPIIEKLSHVEEIIFVPDQYLGHYVSTKVGRRLNLWPGFCPTHVKIMPEDILRLKQRYPEAKVIVHPECRPEVTSLADEVLSTGGMCRYAAQSAAKEMIIGTEKGIIERAVCPNMKLINLEKILWTLEEMEHQVKVPEEIRIKAKSAVDRMLEVV